MTSIEQILHQKNSLKLKNFKNIQKTITEKKVLVDLLKKIDEILMILQMKMSNFIF